MRSKKAVALRYERQHEAAPRVVAKGAGPVAEAIVRSAESAGVSVYEDALLTEALMSMEVDSVIPEELYGVVAEVLAFVYRTKDDTARNR